MSIIDALETILLIKQEAENKANNKQQEQLVEFNSMVIAAAHVNGGGDKAVQEMRENHVKRLSTKVGKAGAIEAQKEMSEMQWPEEVQEAMKRKQQESN